MRHILLAASLAAGLAAGCGSSMTPAASVAPTSPAVDAAFGGRVEIPPAPAGAGIETYTNGTYGFYLQYSAAEYVLFDPPQYANVANRVFELVNRTLPAGALFHPNMGMIVDSRFKGEQISIPGYAAAAPSVLGSYFQDFSVVQQQTFTLDGHPAATIEYTATWLAPDGPAVAFHRKTLYTVNNGDILIFTFTTTPGVFDANRASFDAIMNSITFTQ